MSYSGCATGHVSGCTSDRAVHLSFAPGRMPVQSLRLVGMVVTKLAPYSCPPIRTAITPTDSALALRKSGPHNGLLFRGFATSRQHFAESGYVQAAKDLNQKGLDEQESQLNDAISQEKEKQTKTPWHRDGSDTPPVERQRSAGAMTKGSSSESGGKLLANCVDRQTTDDSFAASKAHLTSDSVRQWLRTGRYRAFSTSGASSTASLLLGTLDSIRTTHYQE